MELNRRAFLKTSLSAGGAALLPGVNRPVGDDRTGIAPGSPVVDLHAHVSVPVMIESIQIVRADGVLFVRTRSTDGLTGISVGNIRMPNLIQLTENLVIPRFIGKDARDVESIIEDVYLNNYKYAGLPFWNAVGQVEWSIMDLLGQVAGKPTASFFGPVIRTQIPVYLSTFDREKPAQETVDELAERLERTGAGAVKLKIGGRMRNNWEPIPGRTERLIPLARKTFGDDLVIYADSNGSYDVEHAIKIGRLMEEYAFAVVEEPVPWEDFAATKQVTDALKMTVAGGEQDSSLPKWQWMIENRALDLLQPDLIYNGGFIRATRVARMAERAGLPISPHAPAMGPEAAMKFQFASVTPNLYGFQEHREEYDERSWYEPKFIIRDGLIELPSGPGLGVSYDPGLWDRSEVVTCK